ncbi:hypothetical protein ACM66B_002896 [Microbotryomycetes sp. NB124-2]
MLPKPFAAMFELLEPAPSVTIRLVKERDVSVDGKHTHKRRQRQRTAHARDLIDPTQTTRRRTSSSSTTSSESNERIDSSTFGHARALSWTVRHLATSAGPAKRERVSNRAAQATTHTTSCWSLSDEGEDDEDDDDDDDSASIGDGSPSCSPMPSLSPSRPRLFPESDDEDIKSDEDDEAATPKSVAATSPPLTPSSSPAWTTQIRTVSRKPLSFDPLLSPPPATPVLSTVKTTSRRASAGWLPAGVTTSSPSLPTVVSIVDETPLFPSARSAATVSAPVRTTPTVSLLTQSLRSLARLPNLSLAPSSSLESVASSAGLVGWDVDGLGPIDDEWTRAATSSSRKSTSTAAKPVVVISDGERVPSVQLKTFNSPTPRPCPRVQSVELDSPHVDVATVPATHVTSAPEPESVVVAVAVPALGPAPPRFISNQRHLLMLSLEISMMHANKIRSPLRPRAVVIRRDGTLSATGLLKQDRTSNGFGSGLRWEVKV